MHSTRSSLPAVAAVFTAATAVLAAVAAVLWLSDPLPDADEASADGARPCQALHAGGGAGTDGRCSARRR